MNLVFALNDYLCRWVAKAVNEPFQFDVAGYPLQAAAKYTPAPV